MNAQDRLLGILQLEKERMQSQDTGFAALLEEAAQVVHAASGVVPCRAYLADELAGAAIILRGRR